MKTKWHLCILWSVLSLCFLSCAADISESQFTRRKKVFKLGTPESKTKVKVSTPSSPFSSQRRDPPPAHSTPRSMRPAKPEAKIQSDFAHLPDVSVTCSTSDLVVRVKPSFYGLSAKADDLKLGSSCKSNGVLRPYGDILFTYPLTACDAVREAAHGYLVYKFVLHYQSSIKRFPNIDVDIECRYQRNHHVYQLAVKPTWRPAVVRKSLKGRPSNYQIQLMDDSWSKPVKSQVYQLGETVNFQVSVLHLPSGGKLYISSCYAAPSSGSKSSLKYTIIDKFGCMLDSKREPGASQFIYRTDKTLRFSMKAFQFTADPGTEVTIHCKLSVTSEEPSSSHKSCTYRGNRWRALTGDDSICACCDSQCATSKSRRSMIEGSASSESLLVSDQPYTEDGFLPVSSSLGGISREGKTTMNQHDDELNTHEYLWESADAVKYDKDEEDKGQTEEELEEVEAESSVTLGAMSEPEFEEFIFRHGVLVEEKKETKVKDLIEFGIDGSGFEVEDDFLQSEEEEERSERREDKISESEVQPLDSEGEKENKKYTYRGEEEERTRGYDLERKTDDNQTNVADDKEMTWYFAWR